MKKNLLSPADVRRYIVSIMTELEKNKLDPRYANSIFMGCNLVLACLKMQEETELKKRIEKLEKLVDLNEIV